MAINIKKINKFTSFCGLNRINFSGEFKEYNVIFGNNGTGKTSLTRAFELLIPKNNHIDKYRTIDSRQPSNIEFELNHNVLNINENDDNSRILPFKVEIYNSDFLQYNAPLNSEFGLKKLDDETIVLEGSGVGEETKELEMLNNKKKNLKERQLEIKNEENPDNTKIKEEQDNIALNNKEIDKIRKDITSQSIKITTDDITINDEHFSHKSKFNYDKNYLENKQKNFDELNGAVKQFESLEEISMPKLLQNEQKGNFDFILNFDIDKEAGEVSQKIKNHISKIGKQFIEDGIKKVDNNICPFCTQNIDSNILSEYASYFNKIVERFNNLSYSICQSLNEEVDNWKMLKDEILRKFDKFQPFIQNFENNKKEFEKSISNLIDLIKKFRENIDLKKGIENKNIYDKLQNDINIEYKNIKKNIDLTKNVLENKSEQNKKLQEQKNELKELKILKAKIDSFDYQINKKKSLENIKKLESEYIELEKELQTIDNQIVELQSKRRPDIEQINIYLKALSLSKYSVNEDYKIIINSSSVIENNNLRIILSDGEKTTIAFAYFLARLKLYYNKDSLKDLVVIIDDPISSLDEHRVYNTSYLVSKINQEIAGEILNRNDEKAQIFVFTHNHTFMTNIIRILGRHASYFQLNRNKDKVEIISKNKVAGYFDTFYLLLFKEILQFSKKEELNDNLNEAINYGNKIRILIESFMKTNFISEFIEDEYKKQSPFELKKIDDIIEIIKEVNTEYRFPNLYFKDENYTINNQEELKTKLDNIVKGLHMESHGTISDYYKQYKLSIYEVQNLARITINIMIVLNPNQTQFYIKASDL